VIEFKVQHSWIVTSLACPVPPQAGITVHRPCAICD